MWLGSSSHCSSASCRSRAPSRSCSRNRSTNSRGTTRRRRKLISRSNVISSSTNDASTNRNHQRPAGHQHLEQAARGDDSPAAASASSSRCRHACVKPFRRNAKTRRQGDRETRRDSVDGRSTNLLVSVSPSLLVSRHSPTANPARRLTLEVSARTRCRRCRPCASGYGRCRSLLRVSSSRIVCGTGQPMRRTSS